MQSVVDQTVGAGAARSKFVEQDRQDRAARVAEAEETRLRTEGINREREEVMQKREEEEEEEEDDDEEEEAEEAEEAEEDEGRLLTSPGKPDLQTSPASSPHCDGVLLVTLLDLVVGGADSVHDTSGASTCTRLLTNSCWRLRLSYSCTRWRRRPRRFGQIGFAAISEGLLQCGRRLQISIFGDRGRNRRRGMPPSNIGAQYGSGRR